MSLSGKSGDNSTVSGGKDTNREAGGKYSAQL